MMKNLNIYLAGTHKGYGKTEHSVNWELINEIGLASEYCYYRYQDVVIPESAILVMMHSESGCINPQFTEEIFLHDTEIYRKLTTRNQHGTAVTTEMWSNRKCDEYSAGCHNQFGFRTPIDKARETQEYWENREEEYEIRQQELSEAEFE